MASKAAKNRSAAAHQTNTINQLREQNDILKRKNNTLEQKAHEAAEKLQAFNTKHQRLQNENEKLKQEARSAIIDTRTSLEAQISAYRLTAVRAHVLRHDTLFPRAVSCINRDLDGRIVRRDTPLPWMLQREIIVLDVFCRYCDPALGPVRRATTVDHIWPKALGGCNHEHNLIGACGPCNLKKADKFCVEVGMKIHHLPLRFFTYTY